VPPDGGIATCSLDDVSFSLSPSLSSSLSFSLGRVSTYARALGCLESTRSPLHATANRKQRTSRFARGVLILRRDASLTIRGQLLTGRLPSFGSPRAPRGELGGAARVPSDARISLRARKSRNVPVVIDLEANLACRAYTHARTRVRVTPRNDQRGSLGHVTRPPRGGRRSRGRERRS